MGENREYLTQSASDGSINISEDVVVAIASEAIGEIEGVGAMMTTMTEQLTEQFMDKKPARGIRMDIQDGEITLEDLTDCPLILYRRYEELIMSAFARRGLKTDVFCICDDARDAMLWVGAGLATAIFPRSMSSLCANLRIRPLAEKELETQTVLIWKKDGRLSPAAREFIDACREEYAAGR